MRFAVRLDHRLEQRLRRVPLDRPLAETARELRSYAASIGIVAPSYTSFRRHIAAERERRAERDAALEVAAALTFSRAVVPTPEGIAAEYDRKVARKLGR